MNTTNRHTVLDWAEQLDTEQRAAQRCHYAHDAGCLADIGIDVPCDASRPLTQPAAADTLDSGIPADGTMLVVAVCGVAAALLASWLMPGPWF